MVSDYFESVICFRKQFANVHKTSNKNREEYLLWCESRCVSTLTTGTCSQPDSLIYNYYPCEQYDSTAVDLP